MLSNQQLPILDGRESGLGGDSNITNKQVRFIPDSKEELQVSFYNADDNTGEKWSSEEIQDLLRAVCYLLSNMVQSKGLCFSVFAKFDIEDDETGELPRKITTEFQSVVDSVLHDHLVAEQKRKKRKTFSMIRL